MADELISPIITPINALSKLCKGCGEIKALSAFSKNKARADGLDTKCKFCNNAKNGIQYRKHIETRKAAAKIFRAENAEKLSQQNRDYREAHKDALNAYTREWRLHNAVVRSEEAKERSRLRALDKYANNTEHRARIRDYAKTYRIKNPEKVKAALKKWNAENRDWRRAYARDYMKTWKTPEEKKEYDRVVRARHSTAKAIRGAIARSKRETIPGAFTDEHRDWLYQWQDSLCFYCNIKLTKENRTFDHIIPVQENGTNHPYNIVRACGPCNFRKQKKIFSVQWNPEIIQPINRFHSISGLHELIGELKAKNISFDKCDTHIKITGRPIFMLSSFWMCSRQAPIETLETLSAKYPGSVFFFDHEWHDRKDAVLNIILAKTQISETVGARKLEIGEPSFEEAKEFVERWHIQGFTGGSYILGLHDTENWRGMAIFRDTKNGYDLNRLAFRDRVQGGFSRLIRAFQGRAPTPKPIFSFCDLRFGNGASYSKIGFQTTGDSAPVMAYVNCVGIHHWYIAKRQNLPRLDYYDEKLSEIENLRANGIFRMTMLPRKKFILPWA